MIEALGIVVSLALLAMVSFLAGVIYASKRIGRAIREAGLDRDAIARLLREFGDTR